MCVTLEVVNRNSEVLIDKENYTISDILDEKYELSLLFDYYGNMLKENHRIIFESQAMDHSLKRNIVPIAYPPPRFPADRHDR
mgnify:CR=1 FL=1